MAIDAGTIAVGLELLAVAPRLGGRRTRPRAQRLLSQVKGITQQAAERGA